MSELQGAPGPASSHSSRPGRAWDLSVSSLRERREEQKKEKKKSPQTSPPQAPKS